MIITGLKAFKNLLNNLRAFLNNLRCEYNYVKENPRVLAFQELIRLTVSSFIR